MRRMQRTLSWLLSLVMLLALASPSLASPAPGLAADMGAQTDAVDSAITWIKRQLQPDGSFTPGFGPPASITLDAVLAGVAAGEDVSQWGEGSSPLEYLATVADEYAVDASSTGKLLVGVLAAGQDPSSFGDLDLRSQITSYLNIDTGIMGDTATAQSWGILGLAALGGGVPSTAVGALKALQQSDGGWESGPGWGTDSNTTAIAVQALAAAGVPSLDQSIQDAVAYLKAQQSPTAGFAYSSAWGTEADANSTANGTQGLLAADENPQGPDWVIAGRTPLDDLLAFQITAGAEAGAFEWKAGQGASLLATVQAVPALVGKTFPLPAKFSSLDLAFQYLLTNQQPDGRISGGGAYDVTSSAIMALAACGKDPRSMAWPATGRSLIDRVTGQATHLGNVGDAGRLAAALAMSGENPYLLGCTNLLDAIGSYYDTETGSFDAHDNIWNHCLAIWGLVSANASVPQQAIAWLKAQRNADGGWGWASGQDSDSNSTAMAVQTLVAAGMDPADSYWDDCVALYHGWQNDDGGFLNDPRYGTASDADSTAMSIQALTALGIDLSSGWDWARTVTATEQITMVINKPLDRLYDYQIAGGAFEWQSGFGANLFATLDAIPAIAGKAYPWQSPTIAAALQAVEWIKGQQQNDGAFPTGFGHPASITLDAMVAGLAVGEDAANWSVSPSSPTALEFLASVAGEYASDAGKTGKLIAALVLAGEDPTSFGGADLVEQLLAYDDGTGMLGTTATDQAWGIIGLTAVRVPVSSAVVSTTVAMQQADGGWESGPGWGTDSNTTGLVLQALAVARADVDPEVAVKAVQYLKAQQSPTGGFSYSSLWGSEADANSTAYGIQGLLAARQDLASPTWVVTGTTPVDDLMRFQIREGADAGAFEWKSSQGANYLLATVQAVPALLKETYPMCTVHTRGYWLPIVLEAVEASQ